MVSALGCLAPVQIGTDARQQIAVAAVAAVVTAIVAVADVNIAGLGVIADSHMLKGVVLDVLVVCSRFVQVAALAIAVVTALDFGTGVVLAAVGAFAHTVSAALLAAACTTEVREEVDHVVAEAVAQAVQAAQNGRGAEDVVAAVRSECVLEVVVEAAVDGSEDIVVVAAHTVAASAAETYHSDQIEAAMEEPVVALVVRSGSSAHRNWDRRSAWCR